MASNVAGELPSGKKAVAASALREGFHATNPTASGNNSPAMKTLLSLLIALSIPAFAKNKEITIAEAPAGVQATVKKATDAGATLEKIELEEASGNKFFGAKITDKNGIRWEIIMDAEGKVTSTEQKKPKKAK